MNPLPELPDTIAYNDLSRRDVRSLIFHLLYAADSLDYQEPLPVVINNFNQGFDLEIPLDSDVAVITQAVIDERDALDAAFITFLDNWRFERVSVVVKLILRFAVWELQQKVTEQRIIINEAIELAKAFAEKDAYRFVNGVLDRMVKSGLF